MIAPTDAGLDIGVVTANPEAMLAFYRDLLGLPVAGEVVIPGGGRIVKLRCGASHFKLFVPDRPPAPAPAGGAFHAHAGLRYATIPLGNIEAVVAACAARGVRVITPVVQPRPGVLAALIADPDGNTLELMQDAGGRA
jgi:catechol 2,3-dioxygenase-like lactoylglutathione lyase family enzyme